MLIQRIVTNESLLEKLGNKFRSFYKIFFVLFVVSVITWVSLIVLVSTTLIANIQVNNVSIQDVVDLVELFFSGAITSLIFLVLELFFRDITKKNTPFCHSQIMRIKLLSFLFFAYGIANIIMSASFTSIEVIEGIGIVHTSTSPNLEVVVSVDITMFIGAIVAYALSVVFEYGSELQKQTDSFL